MEISELEQPIDLYELLNNSRIMLSYKGKILSVRQRYMLMMFLDELVSKREKAEQTNAHRTV